MLLYLIILESDAISGHCSIIEDANMILSWLSNFTKSSLILIKFSRTSFSIGFISIFGLSAIRVIISILIAAAISSLSNHLSKISTKTILGMLNFKIKRRGQAGKTLSRPGESKKCLAKNMKCSGDKDKIYRICYFPAFMV